MSRLLVYSLISGILLGSSWPVNGVTPLIFISLIPLLYTEDIISKDNYGKKNLRLFFYSYLAFLTWNMSTTWWIVYTTIPGAIFANVVNSSFYSIIFLLYTRVKRRLDYKAGSLFLITFWIAFEKFHLNWEFSWPWLNLGNVFSERIDWIQWYEYTGVFGGSLWVLCANFLLFNLLRKYSSFKDKRRFYIRIIPKEKNRVTTSSIKIHPIQNIIIPSPEGYTKPILIQTNDFQKMCKDMNVIGNQIKLSYGETFLKFVCTMDNIFSKEVIFSSGKLNEIGY